ncbi:hypothetical protein HTG_19178 [Natrinema mahii]|nr:hypothetical protein HTG_19178 [Natrinema mahii]
MAVIGRNTVLREYSVIRDAIELYVPIGKDALAVVTRPDGLICLGRLWTNRSDTAVSRRTTAEGHNLIAVIELFSAVRSLSERR